MLPVRSPLERAFTLLHALLHSGRLDSTLHRYGLSRSKTSVSSSWIAMILKCIWWLSILLLRRPYTFRIEFFKTKLYHWAKVFRYGIEHQKIIKIKCSEIICSQVSWHTSSIPAFLRQRLLGFLWVPGYPGLCIESQRFRLARAI